MKNRSVIKRAFLSSLPVMAGYVVLGAGFGVIIRSKGYSIAIACLMSVFIYAGSMQYVAINLLTGGASLLTSAFTTLMVNARHLFYGFSMITRYKNTGKFKPYLIFALTDETYSLVCSDQEDSKEQHLYYFLLSLMNQCYWIIGTLIGSVIGSIITFNSKGMDFALTALFVVIFIDQWQSAKSHTPAIIGLVLSLICLLIFGSSNFLIPSMVLIIAALFAVRKKEEAAND